MNLILRILLSGFLSFAVIVTGSPVQLFLQANAQSNTEKPKSESSSDGEMDKKIDDLRKAFTVEKGFEAELDPFLLTRQVIFDQRPENLEGTLEEEKILDYQSRVDFWGEEITVLEDYLKQTGHHLENLPEEGVKFGEYVKIQADIESRLKVAHLELEDLKGQDPRSSDGLPVDLLVDESIGTRHYWGKKLKVQVTANGEVVETLEQSDFRRSLSPRFNKELTEFPSDQDYRFDILDPKGNILHKFLNPVEAVTFIGQFLVFVEKAYEGSSKEYLSVRFIDLNFVRANVGNAPLPIFTLPLKDMAAQGVQSVSHENGYLEINGVKLSHQQFDVMSRAQQSIFNVNVALVSPNDFKRAQPLIEETFTFFQRAMESQDASFQDRFEKAIDADSFLKDTTAVLDQVKGYTLPSDMVTVKMFGQTPVPKFDREKAVSLVENALKDNKMTFEEFDNIKKNLEVHGALDSTNDALIQSRKFMNRVRMLQQYLMAPRAKGAPTLFESLVIAAVSKSAEDKKRALELAKGSFGVKLAKYGAVTGAAVLIGTQLPEPYTINLAKSLDLVSASYQHFIGYVKHMDYGRSFGDLSADAMKTTVSGAFNVYPNYLSDAKWMKFMYGVYSVLKVPLLAFGAIHFTLNSIKMSYKMYKLNVSTAHSFRFLELFKMTARKDVNDHWQKVVDKEAKVNGETTAKIPLSEKRLLEEVIERDKQGRSESKVLAKEIQHGKYNRQGLYRRAKNLAATYSEKFAVGRYLSDKFKALAGRFSLGSQASMRRALANAFISTSSIHTTFFVAPNLWCYWNLTRTFAWHPHKWLMFVVYPNFFNVTIRKNPGKQHFPSVYNSGLNSWGKNLKVWLSEAAHLTKLSSVKPFNNLFVDKESLRALRAFENAVLPLEIAALDVAKKKAQMALFEHIKDPKRLAILFDSSQKVGEVSTGIAKMNDRKFKVLSSKEKSFYRAYMTRTYDTLMRNMLSEVTDFKAEGVSDPVQFAKAFTANVTADLVKPLKMSQEQVAELEKIAENQIDFTEIEKWSTESSESFSRSLTRLDVNYRHKLLQSISPENGQIAKYLLVQKQLKDPKALDRATKSEVSSLLFSLPLGLGSALMIYAAVDSGLVAPFNAEGWDTDTHYKYMSRLHFWSGFVPGVIMGIMGNTWVKLLMDARIDDRGGFDQVIKFNDGKKGFWRNYLRNTFKNPHNKWFDNQMRSLNIIWYNIPAAMISAIVMDYYGFGRIELDGLLTGYAMIFATFLAGWDGKTEQAFELTKKWIDNRIPRKLRATPEAQKYIGSVFQKKRFLFTWYATLWGTVVELNLIGTMVTMKDSVKYGTRAFMRLVLGGDTPTIIVDRIVNGAIEAVGKIPGAESLLNGFREIFTYRYDAFERFPEWIPEVDGVERVNVDPALPKSVPAEIIGKGVGFTGLVGGTTIAPYAITGWLQKRRERKLQKQGQEYLQERSASALRCSKVFSQ